MNTKTIKVPANAAILNAAMVALSRLATINGKA